jgi:hypothetical protein
MIFYGILSNFFSTTHKLLKSFLQTSFWTSYNLHTTPHKLLTNILQTSYKLLTNILQTSYKLLTNFLQTSYELLTSFFQTIYKHLINFLQYTHDHYWGYNNTINLQKMLVRGFMRPHPVYCNEEKNVYLKYF